MRRWNKTFIICHFSAGWVSTESLDQKSQVQDKTLKKWCGDQDQSGVQQQGEGKVDTETSCASTVRRWQSFSSSSASVQLLGRVLHWIVLTQQRGSTSDSKKSGSQLARVSKTTLTITSFIAIISGTIYRWWWGSVRRQGPTWWQVKSGSGSLTRPPVGPPVVNRKVWQRPQSETMPLI